MNPWRITSSMNQIPLQDLPSRHIHVHLGKTRSLVLHKLYNSKINIQRGPTNEVLPLHRHGIYRVHQYFCMYTETVKNRELLTINSWPQASPPNTLSLSIIYYPIRGLQHNTSGQPTGIRMGQPLLASTGSISWPYWSLSQQLHLIHPWRLREANIYEKTSVIKNRKPLLHQQHHWHHPPQLYFC